MMILPLLVTLVMTAVQVDVINVPLERGINACRQGGTEE